MSTSAEIQAAFKIFGKLLYLDSLVDPQVLAYETGSMGLVDQAVSGQPAEKTAFREVCVATDKSVQGVTQTLTSVHDSVKTNVSAYLSKVLTLTTQLPVNTAPTTVIDGLIDDMTTEGETVLVGGAFYTYFNDTYGRQLPTATSGSETISDGWITAAVV